MKVGRREAVAVALGLALVAAAFVLPRLNWGVIPLRNSTPELFAAHAGAAPIFGWWEAHVGWGTGPAVLIGLGTVVWGPVVAQRLPWLVLTLTTWATACAWAFSLAMIDGWQRGFTGRLTTRDEYLRQVPSITDIPKAVRTFSSRILDFQPNSWITYVSGHPPGALLTFVWLDRIGLRGGAWAGLLCLLAGSSAAAAVVVAVRAVADELTARLVAPFVAVAPTAIWVAVSADGYFAGVAAWGIALLALAVCGSVRFPALVAAGAGLLLGWAVLLNYGLTLMALLALAVLICAPDWRPLFVRWVRPLWLRWQWRWRSLLQASGGSTAIPLCSNAIGRVSPTTARSSTGAGPIWRWWCAQSGWAASPVWAGCSIWPPSAADPVYICCSWRCWLPSCWLT